MLPVLGYGPCTMTFLCHRIWIIKQVVVMSGCVRSNSLLVAREKFERKYSNCHHVWIKSWARRTAFQGANLYGMLRHYWNSQKYGASKFSVPQWKYFSESYPWASAFKNIFQPCPRPKIFKKYWFEKGAKLLAYPRCAHVLDWPWLPQVGKAVGGTNGGLEDFLLAALMQIGPVQLCHFSTQFQMYHTQYMLLKHPDDLLSLQL
jgi:hypothetical protein